MDDYKQNHYQLHLTQQLTTHWNANASLHYTYGRGFYEQYKQAKPFSELGLNDITINDSTLTYGDFVVRKWLDNFIILATESLLGLSAFVEHNNRRSEQLEKCA